MVGITWMAIVLISLSLLFIIPSVVPKKMRFWIPVVFLLGILALLAWFINRRGNKHIIWRTVILEAVGDLMPLVIAFVIAINTLILKMVSLGANGILQVTLLFGLPLFMNCLLFPGPLLSRISRKSYPCYPDRQISNINIHLNHSYYYIVLICITYEPNKLDKSDFYVAIV